MRAVVIESDHCIVKDDVPVPKLGENMALIKTKAVGGNPTDWKHIDYKIGPQGSILGCDVAGEIIELGPNSDSKWSVGDTLCGFVHGASVRHPENGAFAEYVRVDLACAFKLSLQPADGDTISPGTVKTFEAAASLPVGLTTAAQVLTLNLGATLEWEPAKPQHDHPILIWGGATSCGQYFIQLCKKLNAYTKIVAVASSKHTELLKKYGADDVLDYHDDDIIEQIRTKYPNVYHLIDAVSVAATERQVNLCAPTDAPVKVVWLVRLNSDSVIPEEERKENVQLETTMLYQATGEDVIFGDITIPASPAYRKQVTSFVEFITDKVSSGDIQHIPVQIYKGLDSVPSILRDIKRGATGGHKLVATV